MHSKQFFTKIEIYMPLHFNEYTHQNNGRILPDERYRNMYYTLHIDRFYYIDVLQPLYRLIASLSSLMVECLLKKIAISNYENDPTQLSNNFKCRLITFGWMFEMKLYALAMFEVLDLMARRKRN